MLTMPSVDGVRIDPFDSRFNREFDDLFDGVDAQMLNFGNTAVVANSSNIIFANNNLLNLLECETGACSSIIELIYPQDVPEFMLALSEAKQLSQGGVVEVRLKGRANKAVRVEIEINMLDLSAGGFYEPAALLRIRDITKAKLMEQLGGPAIVASVETGKVLLNTDAKNLFGPDKPGTVAGIFLPELVEALLRDGAISADAPVDEMQQAIVQAYGSSVIKINDQYFDLKASLNPESNYLNSQWLNVALDNVTEKFNLEKTLSQQLRMMQEIMARVPFLVVRNYAMGGVVTYANQGAAEYYGVPIDQLLGNKEVQWVNFDAYQEMISEDLAVLSRETDVFESERQVVDRSGVVRTYKVTKKALNAEEVIVMYDEITGERAAELQEIELGARRRSEMEMRTVIHDIASPLSCVVTSAYVANRYFGKDALEAYFRPLREQAVVTAELLQQIKIQMINVHPRPEEVVAIFLKLETQLDRVFTEVGRAHTSILKGVELSLPSIKSSADNMRKMLEDLRDIIHHVGKNFELNMSLTSVTELRQRVAEMVLQFSARAEQEGKTMRIFTSNISDTDAAKIMPMDMARLDRVIGNLIGNAVKYTLEGGTVEVSFDLLDADTEKYALFKVKDTGIGIEQMDLQQVFTAFYRGRNVGSIEGTGIGLATVRAIVEAHGWKIRAESDGNGKGSTFIVTIPLESSAAEA